MSASAQTLPDVLYALLYHRDFREAFIRNGPNAPELCLPPDLADALRGVDLDELSRTAARIRSMIMHGHVDDHGGLIHAFPLSFRLLAQAGHSAQAVVEQFIGSDRFADFREIPFNGKGVTAEEAFHAFLGDDLAAHDDLLRFATDHELLGFLMRTIVTGGSWTFDIRTPLVGSNGVAFHAVLHHDPELTGQLFDPATRGTYLYAAGTRGFVHGPCPPWLDAALRGTEPIPSDRHAKLTALGLIAADHPQEISS